MHLQCSQCAQYGVHEDSNKQVFLIDGTSWCEPHYSEMQDRARENALEYSMAYTHMHKVIADTIAHPGPMTTERLHIP